MSKAEKILEQIKETVAKKAPASEVYLFGSRARGTENPSSDWDLLILLNQNNISFDFETQFMNDFYELELATGQIIAPLIYAKKDWKEKYIHTQIFKNIKDEGIRIL